MTPSVQQQVLRLNVSVGYTHRMQIRNSVQDLLETALDFATLHPPFLDRSIEIATGTVFHDFAPVVSFVLHKIDCLHNVDVVESRGDAEFRRQFLDVILLRLLFATLSELLQSFSNSPSTMPKEYKPSRRTISPDSYPTYAQA